MYDRQATTFLSHRLGRVLAQGQLPFNLYGLLLRSSTGEVVAYSGVSTQPGQIHDATREARLVVLPSWQGVAGKKRSTFGRVCHVSSSCHWHSDGPAPLLLHSISISYHFWSFQFLFFYSNRHFRFQDLESVPSWVPWWVAWWGLQANGFLPRPPTRRWAGHLASLGQCEVGQLGLGMDWAYRSSNLRWKWVLFKTLLCPIAHCFLRAVLTRPFCIQVYLYMYIQARLRAQDNVFIM